MWQYNWDNPNDNIAQSESFKYKIKITGNIPTVGNTKDITIAVPLKYLSSFWRTFEMPLINCEIYLILTMSEDCVISFATEATKFQIAGTELCAPVVTLSTQDNEKPLE